MGGLIVHLLLSSGVCPEWKASEHGAKLHKLRERRRRGDSFCCFYKPRLKLKLTYGARGAR
eukprot:396910-Pleurochrysis_carterae.AAC.1